MFEKIKCFIIGIFTGAIGILGGLFLYKQNSTSDFGRKQQNAAGRVEEERRRVEEERRRVESERQQLETDKRRLEENKSILSEIRNNQKLFSGYNSSIHGNFCDFIRKRNNEEIK